MKHVFFLLILGSAFISNAQKTECLPSFTSKHFVVNNTSDTVFIERHRDTEEVHPSENFVVPPGDRIMVSKMEWAQEFVTPRRWYAFEVQPDNLTFMGNNDNWEFIQIDKYNGEFELSLEEHEEEIVMIAEVEPEFPGGPSALYKWISDNLEYPQFATEHRQGKVYVQFVVEKTGEITNVNVVKSAHKLFTKETMRLMKLMPDWKPGETNGKKVRVRYTLPIHFRLS